MFGAAQPDRAAHFRGGTMLRTIGFLTVLGLVSVLACLVPAGCKAADEILDPAVASKDPDFSIQGEYLGHWLGGEKSALGAQVIAMGDGKFDVYLLQGGLPGAGWKRGNNRTKVEGRREGSATALTGKNVGGKIVDGVMALSMGKGRAELKRVERKSPTLGAKPPAGATLLFKDGAGAENFVEGHVSGLKALLSGPASKEKFGDYTLHLEFLLSYMPRARGQGRSNSGVYVHSCYEIQVLDSFGLEGASNECGGFYGIKEPDVNMCLPPLVWQTYDVEYTGPKYDAAGKKTANARITLKHNGVTIHDHLELPRATPGREGEGPGPRALYLQGHGNKVQYNNVWILEKR